MSVNAKLCLLTLILFSVVLFLPKLVNAAPNERGYDYQLYKNYENFGVLVFPKDLIFAELDKYVEGIGFSRVESGQAVMRFGPKNENQTFMMPKSIQRKYSIERFVILQVIANENMLIGIFDPEWGLTLPSPIYRLDTVKDNISKTLNLFRKYPKKGEAFRLAEEKRQRQQQAQAEKEPPRRKEQLPQLGTGSGFFVSKMGHVITNAHVVHNCKKITIGDNANKQVPAELINTDRSNDLALLKLSTLEMASAESQSLIQKLGITVVPLASKGLLRDEDVRLGEKVLVAGYPFGDVFSNTIKVTSGIVSATRGAGDDSGQFQLDAAVQPGNSGGPIYDSSGNIVGVVISQLDKLKVAKAIGSLPENVNFGIKASTVRQFLTSSGLPSKKSERTEEKSTEQLAEIAKNQALMVMCLQ